MILETIALLYNLRMDYWLQLEKLKFKRNVFHENYSLEFPHAFYDFVSDFKFSLCWYKGNTCMWYLSMKIEKFEFTRNKNYIFFFYNVGLVCDY